MKRIPLTQGQFAIVDDGDYDWLMQWKWHAYRGKYTFYACRSTTRSRKAKRKLLSMHRTIMAIPRGREIDHRNHDGLDNRRCNLRECSRAENQRNRLPEKGGTSKFKGTYWNKGKWQSVITCNGKYTYIGRYASEKDAAAAYNTKAKELFGEFAYLNMIE